MSVAGVDVGYPGIGTSGGVESPDLSHEI
ncbi:hypothetical protein FG05_35157 [Fusarium graminearum]|nr:hypothetical protein FG05_35157 [Fusarium graminearum]